MGHKQYHLLNFCPGCVQEVGINYYGNDVIMYPEPNVNTGEECNQMCVENNACTHWTLDRNSNYCWLKNSSEGRSTVSVAVSGNRCSRPEDEGKTFFSCILLIFLVGKPAQ